MVTLYRPGTGILHRMPAGPKIVLLLVVVLAVSLLPSVWWAAAVSAAVCVVCYLVSGVGMRELGRQVVALRWLIVATMAFQLLFLGPEEAVANTTRVTAAIALAGLLVLTTRVTALLDAVERGLSPLDRIGFDAQRAALLLTVTMSTVPVLARVAGDVREAQRARGSRGSLLLFAVPFLVVSLRHADELGDALAARGVR